MPKSRQAVSDRTPQARVFLDSGPKQLFIDGRWLDSESGSTFESVDPATEEVIANVAEGGARDIDKAVEAARRSFERGVWREKNPHMRTRTMIKIADLIDRHADELAQLIALDGGKPLREARGEVALAIDNFIYYAGWATKIFGETNPSQSEVFNYTLQEPLGVIGQIVPWNGPLMNGSLEIAPALAVGCSIVLKPAEQAPLVPARLAELIAEAGVPDGVFNLVTGYGEVAGAALSRHLDVDGIAFTGSNPVGHSILRDSGTNLKRVHLELGGKSPNVIFGDADLDAAVAGAAFGVFMGSGQVCAATTRVLVQKGIYDEFVQRLVDAASSVRVGDPFDEETTMGPLISAEQHDRVLGYLECGLAEGATARIGGTRGPQSRGYYVTPTVFEADNSMRIAREEIFGPVATVIPFEDEEDAVRQANDTSYGLASAIYTRDVSRAHRVARRIRAGTVWINTTHTLDLSSPFGGYKQSGFGRKRGRHSLDHYVQVKSVFIKL